MIPKKTTKGLIEDLFRSPGQQAMCQDPRSKPPLASAGGVATAARAIIGAGVGATGEDSI
jgi:hypothetical protein